MSFSWSTPFPASFTGLKPATTNSFADALKRLAEHVEEKNKKIEANNGGTATLVQLSTDFQNRKNPSYINHSIPPEQALRLYTQYIQEAERREDIRRSYLRSHGGSNALSINLPTVNRRIDTTDSYRSMAPHLSSLLHPSAYLPSHSPQTRIPPSPFVFPSMKSIDPSARIPSPENADKKSEVSSKPKSKLFRPYDLGSPNCSSHQTSPSSPTATKKATPSPSTFPSSTSVFLEQSQPATSSGKEKQLFNSLGLVQQSTDVLSEKSSFIETSPSVTLSEDSTSIEPITTQQENAFEQSFSTKKDSSSSIKFKRKSSIASSKKSSHRKQARVDTVHETVE